MIRTILILTLTLTTSGCWGTEGDKKPDTTTQSTPQSTPELSPAAKCRGQYTPTYRTTWIPAVGSQAPEYEGSCVVAAGVQG